MLQRLRHRIEYALVMGLRTVVGSLPVSAAEAIGTAIGLLFYAIDGHHRRLAVAQLRAAFPGRSERDCRAIARRIR